MEKDINNYKKNKDYVICIDSDGCALDTMDVKHMRCFGPCLVHEWGLGEYRDDIIRLWRKINLLSRTRGINRFKGLAKMLVEINDNYTRVDGLDELIYWVQTTDELSDESLEEAYERTGCNCMKKALEWSRLSNDAINMVSDSRKAPFMGVEEALQLMKENADIVIMKASNGETIEKEWKINKLDQYVELLMSQESGTKEECMKLIEKCGYEKQHILMIGDAPADKEAADCVQALFFPILAYHESESWDEFIEKGMKHFIDGTFSGEYEKEREEAFLKNLDM